MKRGVIICCSLVLLFLCGCRCAESRTKDNSTRAYSSLSAIIERDSVFLRDSVYVRERADTVFFTRYRTLYKESVVRDTVVVCDTLVTERVVTNLKKVVNPVNSLLLAVVSILLLLLLWRSGFLGWCVRFLGKRFFGV